MPPTANHWESAYLAPKFELARGWLRQLDTTRDDVFYDQGELTDATYSAWLRDNAISYVALPDAPLDYSSAAERRLILAAPALPEPALPARRTGGSTRCATRSRWWRRSAPAAAQTLWVGRQGFALDVTQPGRVPRPRQLHPLLVDRPRQRLHPPPRRLDRRPRLPSRRLPRRRRLLARPGLERGDRRPEDLLTTATDCHAIGGQTHRIAQSASESGSSSRARTRARNSAAGAP